MSPFGPDPIPTPETRPYWDGAARGELLIQLCSACGSHFFYGRAFCPLCWSEEVEWVRASGRATLLSYVISHRAVPPAKPGTVTVIVIVELEEGPRMTSVLVDVEPDPNIIELGSDVFVRFEERGAVTLPVFALAEAA